MGAEVKKMIKYCECCGKKTDTVVITKKENYIVFGEQIEVDADILTCNDCGEELFCEELDNNTLIKAYNVYRKKHKLLLPDEIRKIREQYGLSQRSFAKLLNWGDKTIYRYENGSLQDKAHNSLLVFLKDPRNMITYLTDNEVSLEEKQLIKLLETVNKLDKDMNSFNRANLINMHFSGTPSEENGFKSFDFIKFSAMVLYFVKNNDGLLKTKLMKLLNYADMIYYQEKGVSISGAKYAHLPYGPVPINFDILIGAIEAEGIAHIEVKNGNGYERHEVVSDKDFPDGVLDMEEVNVLRRVNERFSKFGSFEISEHSHRETGYSSTKQGEIISYAYAKDISLD